ncbi:MAG TPA: universal stress protein [Nocardioides sp.]|nr:universal stress protein [Nocardioides sp.]
MNARDAGVVILGVGADDLAPAEAFVVAEAARHGGVVRVVHAILPIQSARVPPPLQVDGDTLRVVGTKVLDDVVGRLEHALGEDVPVESLLLYGAAAHALVDASETARRVVVQRRPRARGHLRTLAIVGNVAGHAPAPVVVVPPGWEPDPGREARVVVAVDDVLTSPQLLSVALDEAAVRGARLRIVHAWYFSELYDEIAFAGPALDLHQDEVRADLTRELAPTLDKRPDVTAELVVVHGRPADVLVEETRSAGLIVLGRHRASVPWGSHLGSVVRAVLHEAECPALVLDSAPRRG